MRIGISGAQSVGKTTVLNALKSEFPEYAICDEVTRWVKSLGIDINEAGGTAAQLLIMSKHEQNIFHHEDFITDRTALDGYVYSIWSKEQGNLSQATLDYIYSKYMEMIHFYDVIFYIEPEFDIVDDGVRSTDVRFRDEIASLFKTVINHSQLKVIKISGTVEERVQQVKETVEKIKEQL